jgi:hypothetical protein
MGRSILVWYDVPMPPFLEKYSSEVMVLLLTAMVLGTLLVLVPQLLRANQRVQEQRHAERTQALDKGLLPPPEDSRARSAGRTASLVPMVTVIAAATVTCFLVAFRSEYLLSVTITVWSVVGVVSLAAITGGVALLGRLAHLDADEEETKEV